MQKIDKKLIYINKDRHLFSLAKIQCFVILLKKSKLLNLGLIIKKTVKYQNLLDI